MNDLAHRADRWFRTYLEWVARHPLAVLLAAMAASAVLATGLPRLRIYVDLDANLPAGHAYVEADKEIRALFGGRYSMAVAFVPRDGTIWTPRMLGLLIALTNEGLELPDVIEANVLSLAAPKAKDIRGTAEGFEVRQILERPPTTEAEIARVREAYELNRRYLGPIVGRDGRAAVLFLDFQESSNDEKIYATCADFVKRFAARYPDAEFFLTGSSSFNHFFTLNAQRTTKYFLVALGVIMTTLYFAFRSVQGTIIPIGTGVLATVWGLGLMGLSGTHMDGWNSMTPILILAVAAGHSVQILKRYYEEYAHLAHVTDGRERNRRAVVEATHKIGLVMVVAGVVAAGSFFSLAVFGIPTIRAFGVFTALGILSAIVLEMTFVPACRTLLRPPRSLTTHASRSDRWLAALGRALATPRVRVACYAGAVLLLAVSAYFTSRIVTNNTVRFYLGEGNEARVGWETMNRHFGGMVGLFVLVEGDAENAVQDPAALGWMAGVTDALRDVPSVNYSLSLADVVRRFHMAMNEDDPAFDRIPDNARLIAQYLFLYGLSADPEDFSRLQTSDGRKALGRIGLRSDEDTDVLAAIHRVEEYAAAHPLPPGVGFRVSGMGAISLAMDQTLTHGKILNMAQILAMIYVISSLILRSPAAGLFVLLPLVLAVAATFALLGAFGIWLNMGTATVAAMGVGIGADYAIYVIYRLREEYRRTRDLPAAAAATLATSGKAVFFVAAAISAGYGALGISDFYVNQILARLVPMTMVVSGTAALTVMVAALLHARPRFLVGSATDAAVDERGDLVAREAEESPQDLLGVLPEERSRARR